MYSTSEREVQPAFERIFEQYGLPEAIRSDNGSPFASASASLGLSQLSSWWVSLGIRLDRIDPDRPDQNGAHERIRRDVRAELQLAPADTIRFPCGLPESSVSPSCAVSRRIRAGSTSPRRAT